MMINKKAWLFLGIIALLLSGFAVASAQSSNSYELLWGVVAGGGGTSSSSTFAVAGTIGQPLSGISSSSDGQYAIASGVWGEQTTAPPSTNFAVYLPITQSP